MNKYLIYFLFLSSLSSQEQKLAVSILDFNGEDVRPKVLKACFQRLETSLIESDKFIVIEKSEREEILEEQKIQSSGICDTDCIVEVGQLLGAEYLMVGEIIDLSGLYQIDIKIINVEKGDITEKVTQEVEGKVKDLLNAMESASNEIIRRLSIQTPIMVQTPLNIKQETVVQKFGLINITTEPTSAIVLIDNQKIGMTPIKGKKIEVGKKNLKIIKSGYNTINKGIRVNETDTLSINELLSYKTGVLELSSNPLGASIYIDNNYVGEAPIKVPELIVGKHEIRASLLDHFDAIESVIVEYAKTTNLKINLSPKPGSLNFVLNVNDVEIYVNDRKYRSDQSGFTTINKLIPGDYNIKLVKAGYKSVEKKLKVIPNKSETIEVEMYIAANTSKSYNSSSLTAQEASILNNYVLPGRKEKFPNELSMWVDVFAGRQINDGYILLDREMTQIKELPEKSSKTIGWISKGEKYKILSSFDRYLEVDVPKKDIKTWGQINTYYSRSLAEIKKENSKQRKSESIKGQGKSSLIDLASFYLLYLFILGLLPPT